MAPSSSQWNGGFGADSGPSRGDAWRRASRPERTSVAAPQSITEVVTRIGRCAQIGPNQPPRNQPEAVMRLLSHQITAGASESVLAMQGARGLTMAETWISIRDTMPN